METETATNPKKVYLREQVDCGDKSWDQLPGCTNNSEVTLLDGTKLPSIPYGGSEGERCHDCMAKPGSFHHPGCDGERCPKCGEQAISCEHLNDWEGYEQQLQDLENLSLK